MPGEGVSLMGKASCGMTGTFVAVARVCALSDGYVNQAAAARAVEVGNKAITVSA